MKNLSLTFLLVFIYLVSCTPSGSSETEPIKLFVEDASDWAMEGEANWVFKNGELVGSSDSLAGFVVTKATFKNFELTLEFNPDSTINSGVYVRCSGGTTPEKCYEINIWDLHPNQEYRTGSVVFKASPLDYVETLNKWNTYRIVCKDNRIQAWVNEVQTVNLEDSDFEEGYIALQAAAVGEVRFRNVEVKTAD